MRRSKKLLRVAGCLVAAFSVVPALGEQPASSPPPKNRQLAFPGAEGFGRFARGGRGGDVYHVTNLHDSGPGSLREGIRSASGPRTIVFDVSGTIELKSRLRIQKSFLTIAGQTAPGDGICLKDRTFNLKNASHIIVRYLRCRLGEKNKPPSSDDDTINTDDVDNVIFDHITSSWGIDSTHDLRRGGNFTLQWSLYAESLNHSTHEKGAHAMLASFRDLTGNISIHHNLFCSSRDRHPTLGSGEKTRAGVIIDYRNNVVYNLSGATNLGDAHINFINNYYRPGPNTPRNNHPLATKVGTKDKLKLFLLGNFFEGNPAATKDNYLAITFDRWADGGYQPMSLGQIRVNKEFDVDGAKPRTDSAAEAYEIVLQNAGASLHRDAADVRLVKGVRDRTNRLIDSTDEVGGWPLLKGGPAPVDTDGDGMPDEWELAHGLNPNDPRDGNADRDGDGYTNLEKYLNSLCPPARGHQP
jgi:pectate lyase